MEVSVVHVCRYGAHPVASRSHRDGTEIWKAATPYAALVGRVAIASGPREPFTLARKGTYMSPLACLLFPASDSQGAASGTLPSSERERERERY